MELILGSGSPRRKQLLTALGFNFSVITGNTDETPSPGLIAAEIATDLACRKANSLKEYIKENTILITADTIVWIDNELLNKPADEEEALFMLQKLKGRTHKVFTGVCLTSKERSAVFSCETDVTFLNVTDKFLKEYIAECHPYDKAGSYGAQECLPEGKIFLSEKEQTFLKKIGQPDLFNQTLAVKDNRHFPLIEKIQGSYFNVMGLPVAELYDELQNFLK
jgi:septum formation protein